MTYYKLVDRINYGKIVKADGRKQYTYVFGESVWEKTGIMLLYFTDRSGFHDAYEEITEKQAYEVIKQTDALYHKLENIGRDMLSRLNVSISDMQTKNLEIRIIYLLYCISKIEKLDIDGLEADGFTTRMVRALKILIDNGDMETDQQMENIVNNTLAMLAKYEDIMQKGKKNERDNIIIEEKLKHDRLVRDTAV